MSADDGRCLGCGALFQHKPDCPGDSPAILDRLREAWSAGWREHHLEWQRQKRDPSHAITRNNPYERDA